MPVKYITYIYSEIKVFIILFYEKLKYEIILRKYEVLA